MDLFLSGVLNAQVFETDVRQATHDLNDVLAAVVRTDSAKVESTHFLMVLAKAPGLTRSELAHLGITPEQWEAGLADCVARGAGGPPPARFTEDCLGETGRGTLEAARAYGQQFRLPRISEAVLLLGALENLSQRVGTLFQEAGIDVERWRQQLRRLVEPVVAVEPFTVDGKLDLGKFSPGGKKVIELMRTETESLGYEAADLRHLLLGLLEYDGGAAHLGLHQQGIGPRRLQEAVMLSLRRRARRDRSTAPLDRPHMQALLQRVLARAGEVTGRDHAPRIAEPHLLRAFLAMDSAARGILESEKVNLAALTQAAERFDLSDEKEEEPFQMADIKVVRERMRQRLVGQDDSIERILPYVQRMRFGFSTPGRPVGVFLFCGQSGSGKTEMAKELARAVYGSEENLIFLEMGQFNAPESMNIFVGAPPGYIGYGEGKLTNGLRDKPRAVVLFDEVEKAHPRVLDALLRFIDEGRIDDPAGPLRDGGQCLVILTSNVGAEDLSKLWREIAGNPNWRTVLRKRLREEFRKHEFRIEFLNRLDEIILFRTLERQDYREIAQRVLEGELERLRRERKIHVTLEANVAASIGDYCDQIAEGARAVRRLAQSVVITPVIDFVVRNSCSPPVNLKVRAVRESPDPDCEPAGSVESAGA